MTVACAFLSTLLGTSLIYDTIVCPGVAPLLTLSPFWLLSITFSRSCSLLLSNPRASWPLPTSLVPQGPLWGDGCD